MKVYAHDLIVETNPEHYDLEKLLPDFHTITEFPPTLNSEQLMYLGHANLIAFMNVLQRSRDVLATNIKNLQKEIDDFDLLGPSCVQTMAQTSGCTWTNPSPHFPSELASIKPSQRAHYRDLPHTCQFGHYIASLCKPQSSLCPADRATACGETCTTCYVNRPFAGSPCIFAENTEELIDTYIGNLIGLQNRYSDFVTQLGPYIDRVNHAKLAIAFSRPRFLRWRSCNYIKRGDHAFNFRVKETPDGRIKITRHRVICKDISKGSFSNQYPDITFLDADRRIKFTCNHTNRVITLYDCNLLRKDLNFARIWLKNYTWPTYNPRDLQIQTALQQAFAELIFA